MGTKVVITLKDPRPLATVQSRLRGTSKRIQCSKLADFFDAMAVGANRATLDLEMVEEAAGEAPKLEVAMPEAEEKPAVKKKKAKKKVTV